MRDSVLELWLRLLALQLNSPSDAAIAYQRYWMTASCGAFNGCVPDHLNEIDDFADGREVVRRAIHDLLEILSRSDAPWNADTLDLLGMNGYEGVERNALKEVAFAFLDLLDGRITRTLTAEEAMPGTKPYRRIQ